MLHFTSQDIFAQNVECTNWLILAEYAKVQEGRDKLKKELPSVQEEIGENIKAPGLAEVENTTVSQS